MNSNETLDNILTTRHVRRRMIRNKHGIETDHDRDVYSRQRILNNMSCRLSRRHHRCKHNLLIETCRTYEELNMKLKLRISCLMAIINQLKDHIRTSVTSHIKRHV
jgi:hypothetical protein